MREYTHMKLEQDDYLDDNDLWDALEEKVRDCDLTSESAWEFFWEKFMESTS